MDDANTADNGTRQAAVDSAAAAQAEQFVRQSKELDLAWLNGTLDRWLDRELDTAMAGYP